MWSDRGGGAARTVAAETEPEPFRYRQAHGSGNGEAPSATDGWAEGADDPKARAKAAEALAFEKGREQGMTQAQAAAQAEVAMERANLRAIVEKFKEERGAYFARIEGEVVQLTLAIARKILHREAQMDPLLLTGMVHVALERLDAGSGVRMRTHPNDIRLWSEYFSHPGSRSAQVELIGDAALRRGECVLETESGATRMSLEGQLKEIEQGFLDLLEHRPTVS